MLHSADFFVKNKFIMGKFILIIIKKQLNQSDFHTRNTKPGEVNKYIDQ